jgi:hypothetical protein
LKHPIRAQIANDVVEPDRRTINAAAVTKVAIACFRQDDPLSSPSFFPPGTDGPSPEGGYKGKEKSWFGVSVGFSDLEEISGGGGRDGSVKA